MCGFGKFLRGGFDPNDVLVDAQGDPEEVEELQEIEKFGIAIRLGLKDRNQGRKVDPKGTQGLWGVFGKGVPIEGRFLKGVFRGDGNEFRSRSDLERGIVQCESRDRF